MIKSIIPIHIFKNSKTYVLSDNQGHTVKATTPESLFDYLLTDYDKPNSTKAVWNLFQLFAVIQSLLPTDLITTLTEKDRVWYKDYKIFSSQGKVISITHKKHLHDNFFEPQEVNIYGLRQYFPDDSVTSLEELTAKANELMTTLNELNWHSAKLSSAIAIYDDVVLHNNYIPTIYDLPDNPETDGMIDYCYQAMNREWRTVYKVGHFLNAVDYDLRSGYPSLIMNFGNTSESLIWHSKQLQRCDFGVCKGTVTINKDYHAIVNNNGQNIIGTYKDILTTEQIGYLYFYGIGRFEIEDGFYLNFLRPDDKPFYALMLDLYMMREHGGLKKTLAKSTSVGIYGRFGQEYPERYGDYFNPIYSLMTTSKCALQVGKFIHNNKLEPDLISVNVDGLLATKDIPLNNNGDIGEWRSEKANALILSVGHQYCGSKMDANRNQYSDMIKALQDSPNKSYYRDVLINKNMMTTNRDYPKFPNCGKDLLNNVYKSEAIID